MTDETAHLVLEMLRAIRGTQLQMAEDILDLKVRVSAVETILSQQQLQLAALNARMDRFELRLDRIERRLELAAA